MKQNGYSSNELVLGDRVDIVCGENTGISNVQDITGDDKLAISIPTLNNLPMSIPYDELINVVYYRQSGMYSFLAVKLREYTEKDTTFIEIQIKSPVSKFQRRDFVRYTKKLPVSLRILASPETVALTGIETIAGRLLDYRYLGMPRAVAENEDVEIISGATVDLSGGGLSFSSGKIFEADSLVEAAITIAPDDILALDCMIVRCVEDAKAPGKKFITSAKFVNIHEKLRRKLIKFIFDEQVKERRRA